MPLPAPDRRERHLAPEEMRRDPPEDELGVGDGGAGAAAAVAHGSGVRARAARPDLEATVRRAPGDRAAAGPDRDEVDHRHLDRVPSDAALGGQPRHPSLDQADVGAVPPASRTGCVEPAARQGAPPSAPAAGPLRIVLIGCSTTSRAEITPPFDFIT